MTVYDVDHLMEIFSDPVAMKHYPATKTKEEALDWIDWNMDNYSRYGVGLWIVEDKRTCRFLGQCGIVPQHVNDRIEMEIGYLFIRDAWGNGFATEAALACKHYGFGEMKYPKLISLIDWHNQPSINVAERIGMKRETIVNKWDKDVCVYACYH
jgi:RimJ/RimL family protein N-acetyltransferase